MENNSGFSDLEMGPLVGGKSTHERKKKPLAASSDGTDGIFGSISAGNSSTDAMKTMDFLSSSSGPTDDNNRDLSSGTAVGSQSQSSGTAKYTSRKGNSTVAGKVVFACSLYAFCSVSMVLVNKSLASRCVSYPKTWSFLSNLYPHWLIYCRSLLYSAIIILSMEILTFSLWYCKPSLQ